MIRKKTMSTLIRPTSVFSVVIGVLSMSAQGEDLSVARHNLLSQKGTAKATGSVSKPIESQGASRDEESHRPVVLVPPMSLVTSSFAGDLNNIMMSRELMDRIESTAKARLGAIRVQNGFWYRDQSYSLLNVDTVGGTRPYGNGSADEIAVRKEMALMMRQYMLTKGIPAYLASKNETKGIAAAYQQTMNATKVEFQSGDSKSDPWKYTMGVDPFRDLKLGRGIFGDRLTGWFSARNSRWTLETSQNLMKPEDISLSASRSFDWYNQGDLRAESQYHVIPKIARPKVTKSITRSLATSIESSIPVASSDALGNSYSSVSMSYSF